MNIKQVMNRILMVFFLLNGLLLCADNSLENYIKLGLENNLALQQQRFSLEKSLQSLVEAKGMFLPSVSIEARYSRAGGGRLIDVPIGDLVNPIHTTLNELLMLHGFTPGYPANIPNESIPFLRETEHETKLRIVQPVFQPAIYYNVKIKKDLTGIEKAKLNVFKQQLITDIKSAYFRYLQTVNIKKLLDSTRELLKENLRISESLFRNNKVTEEVVFRSKAELSKLDQQREEAEKNIRMASAYFNFLLNRPLEELIEIRKNGGEPVIKEYDFEQLAAHAIQHREEFQQLQGAIDAASHSIGLHKSSILPAVTAVFDYGFQGEKYSFTGKDDYWMGSLLFSWNLFRGGQDAAKKKQALFEKKRLQTQKIELENQIKLQVKEAYHNLEVAKKALVSTRDILKSQEEAFFIISKKYEQGMVPQIEYIKARDDFTNAGISHIIAIYDYFIKEAQLERASCIALVIK